MSSYIRYPTGGAIQTYDTFADFPNSASNGSVALALDTDTLYAFNLPTTTWVIIGGASSVLNIGTIDSGTASDDGASISLNELIMQSASVNKPGLVNTAAQNFSGLKTFLDGIKSSIVKTSGGNDSIAVDSRFLSDGSAVQMRWNGSIVFPQLTATTVPILSGSKTLTSSAVTPTELGYLSGVSSAIQTQLNAKVGTIGTIDSQVAAANGAVITGSSLVMQSASATVPGLVNLTTQSFAGNKTFTGTIAASNFSGSSSGTNTGDVTIGTANGLSLASQVLSLGLSSTSTIGALSNTDWNTFNNKQASGNYITALSGDVVATGPGSVSATIQSNVITNAMVNSSAAIAYSKLNLATSILNADINASAAIVYSKLSLSNSILNADINSAAAIAYSKLNLSNSILNADINTSAAIAYSKLNLSGSILNADINASAAIAYSKLNLATSILNADISASAAIAFSKLAALASANILVGSAGNVATAVAVTGDISLTNGGVTAYSGTVPLNKGGTGQTTKAAAFDALSPMTTLGDIVYGGTAGTGTRLGIGGSNQILQVVGGLPVWATPASGGINYVTNPNAEADTSGWATYADAAANIPVDGTGGTATNLTFSRSTSSPLIGVASFSMAQANSTSLQGKGVSYDFTIDSAYQAAMLQISFNFNASSTFVSSDGTTAPLNDGTTTTNAGNSDIEVFLYDVTNAVLIPVSPEVIAAKGANNFQFKGEFQTASNSTSYRLILHIATTSANATGWTFKFDNVFVGPQPVILGPPVTDWVSYTPTFVGFGTPTGVSVWSRRLGDTLQFRGVFTAGTVTGSVASMTLGYNGTNSNVTVDTTKIGGTLIVGHGNLDFSSTTYFTLDMLIVASTSLLNFGLQVSTRNSATADTGTNIGTGRQVAFYGQVPIAGWSSTTLMSNDTSSRIVAARAGGATTTIGTSATDIINGTTAYDTHGAYNAATGVYTVPVSGLYKATTFLTRGSAAASAVNQNIHVYIYKNGSSNAQIAAHVAQTTSSVNAVMAGSAEVQCVAGDLLKLSGIRDTNAGSAALNGDTGDCFVTFERLSGPSAINSLESVNARYYASATSISASLATISWTTKDYDSHNAMSAGTYTVPVSGKYDITVAVAVAGTFILNKVTIIEIQKNGTVVSRVKNYAGAAVTQLPGFISDQINCLAGDTLRIQLSNDGTSPTIASSNFENYISIFRTGN